MVAGTSCNHLSGLIAHSDSSLGCAPFKGKVSWTMTSEGSATTEYYNEEVYMSSRGYELRQILAMRFEIPEEIEA